MKALYPFVGGTASQHKFNLKNPLDTDAAFRLVFNGGATHSVNGYQPNGTNGYADTKFIPSVNQNLNSNGLGVYITQNSSGRPDPIIMGSFNGTLQASLLVSTSTNLATRLNGNTVSNAITGGLGSFDIQKTSSTVTKIYKNGILLNTGNSGGTLPIVNNFIGTMNYIGTPYGDGCVNSQFRFAYLSDGLSDTEIANLRTSVQTFQTTLGRSIGTQTVSDADAQAFVTNAGIVDQVEANAVNNLVIGMKADGLWSKMKAIYPFVGGTASTHKFNLKNPLDTDAAFRLVFNGGWTHSSTGATPNGTNGYADTKLNLNSVLTLNNTSLSIYSRTNNSGNIVDMGATVSSTDAFGFSIKWSDNNGYYNVYNTSTNRITINSVSNSSGLTLLSRTLNVNAKAYRNGSQVGSTNTNTQNNTSLTNKIIFIGADNAAAPIYYSNREMAFASIGDGLTDTEASNFYTAVQTFQTALNRQV
jgi:hypothetical protein